MAKRVKWSDQASPAAPLVCIKLIKSVDEINREFNEAEHKTLVRSEYRQQNLKVLITTLTKFLDKETPPHVVIDFAVNLPSLNSPV